MLIRCTEEILLEGIRFGTQYVMEEGDAKEMINNGARSYTESIVLNKAIRPAAYRHRVPGLLGWLGIRGPVSSEELT